MSKHPLPIAHDIRPARSKSKLSRIVPILVVTGLLGPLAAESASLCYAQWSEVLSGPAEAQTPLINLLAAGLHTAHDLFSDHIAPSLRSSFRDPSVALPVALGLIVLGMLMLRR